MIYPWLQFFLDAATLLAIVLYVAAFGLMGALGHSAPEQCSQMTSVLGSELCRFSYISTSEAACAAYGVVASFFAILAVVRHAVDCATPMEHTDGEAGYLQSHLNQP